MSFRFTTCVLETNEEEFWQVDEMISDIRLLKESNTFVVLRVCEWEKARKVLRY
jgi:hypothetical protein